LSENTTPKFITTPNFSDNKNLRVKEWDKEDDLDDIKKRI